MKKGQVALEYLLIASFLLIATGIVFILSTITLEENLRFAKADKALSELATAAERVSSRGPNNAIFVEIDLPGEIQSDQLNISNKTIFLTILTSTGINERHITTKAELTPAVISVKDGFNNIKVELVDANVVFTRV